jgi:hypothetical protein
MLVTCACMYIYLCVVIFLAIESNEECTEEGEVFEYQEEEGQGLANQGKPSKLDAYLNPIHMFCMFHNVLLKCMIYIAIVLVAISCWLKLHEPNCYHPSR